MIGCESYLSNSIFSTSHFLKESENIFVFVKRNTHRGDTSYFILPNIHSCFRAIRNMLKIIIHSDKSKKDLHVKWTITSLAPQSQHEVSFFLLPRSEVGLWAEESYFPKNKWKLEINITKPDGCHQPYIKYPLNPFLPKVNAKFF